MTFPIIDAVFSPLYGKPCWNVKPGTGSFITLEFGEPHLGIREPLSVIKGASEKRNRYRTRRKIFLKGDWRLWIYCCEWQVFTHSRLVGDSDPEGSTKERIEAATYELDGQRLINVTVDPSHGSSVFEFDLGSRLETMPYAGLDADQWLLYEPSGDVFTYGFDGRYKHQPGNTLPENGVWQAFPGTPSG